MSTSETLRRCQERIVRLYRVRAYEALAKARQARQDGDQAAHCGYLSEALFWRTHADAWARKARETLQPAAMLGSQQSALSGHEGGNTHPVN